MARVLLVDDDPDQLMLRGMLLEKAGHAIVTAPSAETALRCLAPAPEMAVVDLGLPTPEDGFSLLREMHAASPATKIIVLTGWRGALTGRPEADFVEEVLEKPCPTPKLLASLGRLLVGVLLLIAPAAAREFSFDANGRGETIAELDLRSAGADFEITARAAAVAVLRVDGGEPHHVIVLGERRDKYVVFLGSLSAGRHTLTVEREERLSAPDAPLEVRGAKFREDSSDWIANAPVLFAREDTVGTFSDIPLLVYYEQEPFQYSVIFSNQDGGTSTRGLMARWGRTTDIEHLYRLDGSQWWIQTRDHKDVPYDGPFDGKHPLLIPITKNNMVGAGRGSLRFQMAPQKADLRSHSREAVMDNLPWTYAVAAKELIREKRQSEIGDPRSYVYLEAKITNQRSRTAFRLRLVTEQHWRSSHRGDPRLAIERDGWVRSTIELPAGTSAKQIAEFGIECLPENDDPKPDCKLEELSPAFFLTPDYLPGRKFSLPRP